jgi:hypothetical protein
MARTNVRAALLRLLSRWLWAGAILLARQAANAVRLATGDGQSDDGQPGELPHWLSHTGDGGPPAHWLAYIGQKAPFLLRGAVPVQRLTPDDPDVTGPLPASREEEARPAPAPRRPFSAARVALSRQWEQFRAMVFRREPPVDLPLAGEEGASGEHAAGREPAEHEIGPWRETAARRPAAQQPHAPSAGAAQPQPEPVPPRQRPTLQGLSVSPPGANQQTEADATREGGRRVRFTSIGFRPAPAADRPSTPPAPPPDGPTGTAGPLAPQPPSDAPGATPADIPLRLSPWPRPEAVGAWLGVRERPQAAPRHREASRPAPTPPWEIAPRPGADWPQEERSAAPERALWAQWEGEMERPPPAAADEDEEDQSPWPTLLDQDLGEDVPRLWWEDRWQAWRRRERWDREQRGLPWNE